MIEKIRDFLCQEYQRRSTRNPRYSKRAYATDLGVSRSTLLDFLSGRRGLSQTSIDSIKKRLNITEVEIQQLSDFNSRHLLTEDQLRQLSDPTYFSVLALSEIENCSSNPNWISKVLEVDVKTVEKILKVLSDENLIDLDGDTLQRKSSSVSTSSGYPSRIIKDLHASNLSRAKKSLYNTPIDEREFSSITAAIDENQFELIKKYSEDFRDKVSKLIDKKKKPNRIYTVSIQIFPQSKKIQEV